MSIAVFVLTILCLQAGHSNDYMSDFAILTMNTTGWKANYTASTSLTLPIRDYYSVYMETSCKGWYGIKNVSLGRQAESNCTKPSSYCMFYPLLHFLPSIHKPSFTLNSILLTSVLSHS